MSNPLNIDFVSRVINGVNAVTKDDHISKRYVLKIGRDKARTYISQKLKDRTVFRETPVYTHIPCLELKQIEIVKCPVVEFRRCDVLMRSKKKLPETIYSSYGAGVLLITSIDGENEIKLQSITEFLSGKKRMFSSGGVKAYIHDGYLYVPNHEIEAVNIDVLTLDKKSANDASGCMEFDSCKSVWEYPFICLDRSYEPIVQETINEILNKRRIPTDENPNLDNNQKSQLTD